jgi:3,4-dihydroxy 2-butanone 4-phosphate synthase/GTP cyclohydrolase II
MPSPISPVEDIVAELAAGRMVILVDEEDRENEGDLLIAADHITPEAINFMVTHARGLVCLTLTRERCEHLKLPPMAAQNGTVFSTAFTVSIEAAEGVTTGISAADRAHTIAVAVGKNTQAADLVQPGHIFPLQAKEGGVLMRAGHTEAGCDLAAMAGCSPTAVICEILKDDGSMARLPDLQVFAEKHGLKIGTIADLIEYRSRTESLLQKIGSRPMRTAQGDFTATLYRDLPSGQVHMALSLGSWQAGETVPVRVHGPFTLQSALEAGVTGHSWSLDAALRHLQAQGKGVAILLNSEAGLASLEASFAPASAPPATLATRSKPDIRTYGVGAQILRDLGVTHMQLLSKPLHLPSMTGYGLEVMGYLDSNT